MDAKKKQWLNQHLNNIKQLVTDTIQGMGGYPTSEVYDEFQKKVRNELSLLRDKVLSVKEEETMPIPAGSNVMYDGKQWKLLGAGAGQAILGRANEGTLASWSEVSLVPVT
jgi:hypothetical protein